MFRYISFTIRFALFRVTAFPKLRDAETAIRFRSSSFLTSFILTPGQLTCLCEPNVRLIAGRPRSRSLLVRLFLIGDTELCATLPTSSHQHEPTTLCLHSRPEAEFPVSFYPTRLICPLHRERSFAILHSLNLRSTVLFSRPFSFYPAMRGTSAVSPRRLSAIVIRGVPACGQACRIRF